MLFLFQQYQEVILILLKILFKKNLLYPSAFFTLRASRSHCICFVAVHLRYTCTAVWTDASHLQQTRLVNNPGYDSLRIQKVTYQIWWLIKGIPNPCEE
jgi:hypothetical protein